jgi:hypothetical protein
MNAVTLLAPTIQGPEPVPIGKKKRARIVCTRCQVEKDGCTFPKGSSECVKCLNSRENGEESPRPMRKKCPGCNRMKSAKAFRNKNGMCRLCLNTAGPLTPENITSISEQRKCSGCGVTTFASRFRGPTSICLKCWSKIDKDQTLEDLIVQYHHLKLEYQELKSNSPEKTSSERGYPPAPARTPNLAYEDFVNKSPNPL